MNEQEAKQGPWLEERIALFGIEAVEAEVNAMLAVEAQRDVLAGALRDVMETLRCARAYIGRGQPAEQEDMRRDINAELRAAAIVLAGLDGVA